MFWRKKKESEKKTPIKPLIAKDNKFTVSMRDGNDVSFTRRDWPGTEKIEPWKDFYKWFFGRTGDVYVMRYYNGESMFRREDIKRFNVHVSERTVDA